MIHVTALVTRHDMRAIVLLAKCRGRIRKILAHRLQCLAEDIMMHERLVPQHVRRMYAQYHERLAIVVTTPHDERPTIDDAFAESIVTEDLLKKCPELGELDLGVWVRGKTRRGKYTHRLGGEMFRAIEQLLMREAVLHQQQAS